MVQGLCGLGLVGGGPRDLPYLATVIDLFNWEVAGWAVADHHRVDLICDAIRMAKRIKRRAIFHSDRGAEYTSRQFRRCLEEAMMRPSMGRVGTCLLTGQCG